MRTCQYLEIEMNAKLKAEIALLESLKMRQLADKYEALFGEPTRSRHKRYLIRRIAWRLQANAEGGLSLRARMRAKELANHADLRVTAPRYNPIDQRYALGTAKSNVDRDSRLPCPGSWIERNYKGQLIRVLVHEDDFEFNHRRFKSLSAVAKIITGSHVNGFVFFQLGRKK
jgi:hypothetical protein